MCSSFSAIYDSCFGWNRNNCRNKAIMKEIGRSRNRECNMQHAWDNITYLIWWEKKKKISTMKLYKIGMLTHLFRRRAYCSTCGTILTLNKRFDFASLQVNLSKMSTRLQVFGCCCCFGWTWTVFKTAQNYYVSSKHFNFLFSRSPSLFFLVLFICVPLSIAHLDYLLLTSSSSVVSRVSVILFRNNMVFHKKIIQWNREGGKSNQRYCD